MSKIVPAAAVMLTRSDPDGDRYYLVHRAEALAFLGGFWAFPGGKIDRFERDASSALVEAARLAAVRELFEEVDVLVPPLDRIVAADERQALREALWRGDVTTWRTLDAHVLEAGANLEEVCWRTTPPFAPVRYQTAFFRLVLPPGQEPEVDGHELIDGRFDRAEDVLSAWNRGERPVVPPTLAILELIAAHGEPRWTEAARELSHSIEKGVLAPIRWTPGVFVAPLATETIPPATTTNCHLVGEATFYVVDPASAEPAEIDALARCVEERLANGQRCEGILVTHHHPDHVGGVRAIAERFQLPVLAHPETLERIDTGTAPVHALSDLDVLDLGEAPDGTRPWSLTAFHTPGHDRGHLCFLESRYRALIAGDLCSTISTIVIDPPEGHLATYLASLERMRDVGIGSLLPAHGPVARDGMALLGRYLDHRAQRESKLLDALRQGARTPEAFLPEVYADTDPRLFALAARSLEAGLRKLEEEGRAIHDPAAGTWMSA